MIKDMDFPKLISKKECEAQVNRAKTPNTRGFMNFEENPAKDHKHNTRNRREYKPPHEC